ncbi:mannose-1-phosphate guanylyltransferase/mannose-6-phosphate isomerase [Desulfotalea psychrophila]|uniref:mannose-1-phosphate guanylyltransferase n=1 Tax=Desulfotalea psychrophila (strain LSv54 / DSM 12343) TaxID=177439 RepID=Q6AJ25_DESPS|nr:mannose-1-phosphate guanylyltransferase/mannose-6-phosphate isomerase [Desulfotalea psychrophila]CAG37655.1 probable mannose-1-phosphate guanylyltransferase [Desulfotalea psychrophila LSv54]
MIVPVIMAGGSGTRLWPLSRALYPKQFLPLVGEETMLQATLNRLAGLDVTAPITVCNEEHRFIVAEQLRFLDQLGKIILEPAGRNTAPAVALAASIALEKGEDPLLLVLAADHVIEDSAGFVQAIQQALPLAEEGCLVTFGIVPTSAHTGYGYIRRGGPAAVGFRVEEFVEKPDAAVAKQYFEGGEFYWNSGMFLFRASTYLAELRKHRADIADACLASLVSTCHDGDFIRVDKDYFLACPEESIDYAVMEKTEDAVVVPLDVGWNDIGSWSALWEVGDKDAQGNRVRGDVFLQETTNSLVHGGDRLIATIGLDNVVVVDTKDALLVATKDRVQEVKQIVQRLKDEGRSEARLHREVYRPWGKYDSIDAGGRYQVKRISVKPDAKLSVQMHHHRAEHWIVVSGTARVTKGEDVFLVTENESTFIPVGVLHALENPGKVDLELIEVQSGPYLGEDDIVRFEDLYGRIESCSDAQSKKKREV